MVLKKSNQIKEATAQYEKGNERKKEKMEGKKEIRYRRLASGNEPLVLMADDGNQ